MKKLSLFLALILVFNAAGCSTKVLKVDKPSQDTVKIARRPAEASFNRYRLKILPAYNENSDDNWQVDLRSYDLSELDLSNRKKDLLYADFDSKTVWPEKLPSGFEPEKIMELGKNPGLKIQELHKKGITGKGVGIAIIDQALLVEHKEYKDNLKLYEEIHYPEGEAQMHGPAVASIAVGKNVGVAPEAELYYIAEQHWEYKNNDFEYDFNWLAQSINRILEINKSLSKERKIRVISISVGWNEGQKGYKEVMAAVEEAKKQNVFVVSSALFSSYGYLFHGLGRNSLKNPDEVSSYEPGSWWAKSFYNGEMGKKIKELKVEDMLLVPMDSRAVASPTGKEDYVFYRQGGWSWSIPYIAGLYALACQVKPDITPEVFWTEALKTGETITVEDNNKKYELGKIVSPWTLINNLQSQK